jgi:adenylate kinase
MPRASAGALWKTRSVRKYVIMGVQGSGKGTQAGLLATDLDLVHVSVGDMFRWHVQHHTKIGAQVRRTMAAGGLVDDDLVEAIVRDRLAIHDWNYGFILDGFPRNARQAEFFLESYDIDGVILLELPDEEVQIRVFARRDASGPASRADDTAEALAMRLREYHEKTRPIIELFERKEFVAHVDATKSVEEVQADIRRQLALPQLRPTRAP